MIARWPRPERFSLPLLSLEPFSWLHSPASARTQRRAPISLGRWCAFAECAARKPHSSHEKNSLLSFSRGRSLVRRAHLLARTRNALAPVRRTHAPSETVNAAGDRCVRSRRAPNAAALATRSALRQRLARLEREPIFTAPHSRIGRKRQSKCHFSFREIELRASALCCGNQTLC